MNYMKKHVQKDEEEIKEEVGEKGVEEESGELIRLRALWDELKTLGVNSISDLEVKIARLQK
jgi:hypothetical protein